MNKLKSVFSHVVKAIGGFDLVIPVSVGLFFYAFFSRFHGLNPTQTDWLLPFWNGNIDSAANYLGWEYFRAAPIFQWPLGRIPNLGPGSGASIAMTDSIPLMAFLFKPFTHWYRGTFQYFGIWTLGCFVMQAVSSWKLLGLWIKSRMHLVLGCTFFVIAPAFLDRMTFHFGLAAQWLILLALYFFFKQEFSFKAWVCLGVLATMIQPYLAMMVSAVFFFSLLKQQHFTKRLSLYLLAIGIAAWQAGLFVFGFSNVGLDGFGVYSANGLSLVDPGFSEFNRMPWSLKVPNQWENVGQYEGFSFVGSGLLLLAAVLYVGFLRNIGRIGTNRALLVPIPAIIYFLIHRDAFSTLLLLEAILLSICAHAVFRYVIADKLRAIKMLVLSALFGLFAISNIIFIGDHYLGQYIVPKFFMDLIAIARTSGRFIWLPMYLVITVVIVLLVRNFPKHVSPIFMACALLVQVNDSSSATRYVHDLFTRSGPENVLPSSTWDVFGENYSSVAFVPAAHKPRLFDTNPDFLNTSGWLWRDIGVLGQKYDWNLNSFYFGRVPDSAFIRENVQIEKSILNGEYDSSTLYIFIDSDAWEKAKKSINSSDLIGTLDGVPVVAPGLSECATCDFSTFSNKSPLGHVG
jgi:hypothetical protein